MKPFRSDEFNEGENAGLLDDIPFWSAPFGLKLLENIRYIPGITALDIGSGTGFPLLELAARLGEGSSVYGIEPWKEMNARSRAKIKGYGLTNVTLIEAEAESLPFDDRSADLIVSNNGINNVQNRQQVIAECSRVIKPGGQFIFTMNLDKSMFELYTVLETVLAEMQLTREIELMHQHIKSKRPSLDEMINALRDNNFTIRALEHDQFNYRFATGTALLNHYFIRLAFMSAWVKLLPDDQIQTIFDTIEERLNEQSGTTNGINLSIPFVLIDAIKN
ncbi:MAG TPA: methyltransferase domain-containing protein [Bacteroidales bacterium]|nr:methyltransferase domain-containing protein [Bacteroidales bacterium]